MRPVLSVLLCLIATPAFAEVCEKMRTDWDPRSGPVGQAGETILMLNSVPGYVLLALAVAAVATRRRTLYVLFAVWTLLIILLRWLPFLESWLPILDDGPGGVGHVLNAARDEGCLVAPYLASVLLFCLAAVMAWKARRRIA